MKKVNFKRIMMIIVKIIVTLIILSVFMKLLYGIANNIYENRKNINETQQNEVVIQNNSENLLEDEEQNEWYEELYWKFAYIVFIIYAFYTYGKNRNKWWRWN